MRPTPYNSQIVSEKKNQISQSVLILEKINSVFEQIQKNLKDQQQNEVLQIYPSSWFIYIKFEI